MTNKNITISEKDILKTVLEYLKQRNHFEALRSLERDTQLSVDEDIGDDLGFIRNLVLDGKWKDLESTFDILKTEDCRFAISKAQFFARRQHFLELLSKQEPPASSKSLKVALNSISELDYCTMEQLNQLRFCLANMDPTAYFPSWTRDRGRYRCFLYLVEQTGLGEIFLNDPSSLKISAEKCPKLVEVFKNAVAYSENIETKEKKPTLQTQCKSCFHVIPVCNSCSATQCRTQATAFPQCSCKQQVISIGDPVTISVDPYFTPTTESEARRFCNQNELFSRERESIPRPKLNQNLSQSVSFDIPNTPIKLNETQPLRTEDSATDFHTAAKLASFAVHWQKRSQQHSNPSGNESMEKKNDSSLGKYNYSDGSPKVAKAASAAINREKLAQRQTNAIEKERNEEVLHSPLGKENVSYSFRNAANVASAAIHWKKLAHRKINSINNAVNDKTKDTPKETYANDVYETAEAAVATQGNSSASRRGNFFNNEADGHLDTSFGFENVQNDEAMAEILTKSNELENKTDDFVSNGFGDQAIPLEEFEDDDKDKLETAATALISPNGLFSTGKQPSPGEDYKSPTSKRKMPRKEGFGDMVTKCPQDYAQLASTENENWITNFHPCSVLIEGSNPVRTVEFSSDGCEVIIGSNSKSIHITRILDVDFCNSNSIFTNIAPALHPQTLNPASNNLKRTRNICFGYHSIMPSELPLFPVQYEEKGAHLGSVYCLAWHPGIVETPIHGNVKLFASGSNDKMVKVWQLHEFQNQESASFTSMMKPIHKFQGHNSTIRDVMFLNGHGSEIVLASAAGGANGIMLWDVAGSKSKKPLQVLKGHRASVFGIAKNDVDNSIVSCSEDSTIRVWDVRAERSSICIPSESIPHAITYSSSTNHTIATGHLDGSCRVWDIRKGAPMYCLKQHNDDVRSVDFSPDGRWLLTASFDGMVGIVDTEAFTQDFVGTFRGHGEKVLQAKWHPKQPYFVTCSADNTAKVWTMAGKKTVENMTPTQLSELLQRNQ